MLYHRQMGCAWGVVAQQLECRNVNREDGSSSPPAAESHWSLLPDVYPRRSERFYTGGKSFTCLGFNDSNLKIGWVLL